MVVAMPESLRPVGQFGKRSGDTIFSLRERDFSDESLRMRYAYATREATKGIRKVVAAVLGHKSRSYLDDWCAGEEKRSPGETVAIVTERAIKEGIPSSLAIVEQLCRDLCDPTWLEALASDIRRERGGAALTLEKAAAELDAAKRAMTNGHPGDAIATCRWAKRCVDLAQEISREVRGCGTAIGNGAAEKVEALGGTPKAS